MNLDMHVRASPRVKCGPCGLAYYVWQVGTSYHLWNTYQILGITQSTLNALSDSLLETLLDIGTIIPTL